MADLPCVKVVMSPAVNRSVFVDNGVQHKV